VIGASAQDVQMSGSMTGGHVAACPLALLTDEGSPKAFIGALISGAVFFWVLFFSLYKEKYHAAKRRNQNCDKREILQINKVRLSGDIFLLDSRIRGNDGPMLLFAKKSETKTKD